MKMLCRILQQGWWNRQLHQSAVQCKNVITQKEEEEKQKKKKKKIARIRRKVELNSGIGRAYVYPVGEGVGVRAVLINFRVCTCVCVRRRVCVSLPERPFFATRIKSWAALQLRSPRSWCKFRTAEACMSRCVRACVCHVCVVECEKILCSRRKMLRVKILCECNATGIIYDAAQTIWIKRL